MKRISLSVLLIASLILPAYAAAAEPDGAAEIRGPLLDSEIVIRTTNRLAGAIDSVTWRAQEFIDSADHGRQLQSASNFDVGGQFIPETFNPTEAGSVADGAGPTSTSQLLHLLAGNNRLQTTNRMAFWLPPDGKSQGNPARKPLPCRTICSPSESQSVIAICRRLFSTMLPLACRLMNRTATPSLKWSPATCRRSSRNSSGTMPRPIPLSSWIAGRANRSCPLCSPPLMASLQWAASLPIVSGPAGQAPGTAVSNSNGRTSQNGIASSGCEIKTEFRREIMRFAHSW